MTQLSDSYSALLTGLKQRIRNAVDDLLRHPDDQPSIGIILCKGRNEIVVEYALRDSSKPMGVAQYRLSAGLSERLKRDLPTVEDLEHAFQSIVAMELNGPHLNTHARRMSPSRVSTARLPGKTRASR